MSGLWRFRNVTGEIVLGGIVLYGTKKLLKKTHSVIVVAVNESWFISFVRSNLKLGRRMK